MPMAAPRFTGLGFTNPTNPLALHSESRHRELTPMGHDFQSFQADERVFGAGGGVLSKSILRAIRAAGGGAEKAAMKGLPKAWDDGVKKAHARTIRDVVEKRLTDAAENAIEGGAKDGGEAAIRDVLRGGITGTAEKVPPRAVKAASKGFDDALGGAADVGAADIAKLGIRGTMKKYSVVGAVHAAILVVPVTLAYVLATTGAEGLANWVASQTGLDCDTKAIEAGYEEGTDEYTEVVTKCQKESSKMMTAMTIGAVAVAGLVVVMIFK